MNTQLNTFTQAELENVKFSELANIYNSFAAELGIKQIKKFRDKATGQARVIQIQEQYVEECVEWEEPEVEQEQPKVEEVKQSEPTKRQTRFDMDAKIETAEDNSKEGTIENSLHAAIASGCNTAGEIVEWVTTNHKRPRSGQPVDEQYVIHNIKWFVKKGTLKLVK